MDAIGYCPACSHWWGEHAGSGNDEDGVCGECVYEVQHNMRAATGVCRREWVRTDGADATRFPCPCCGHLTMHEEQRGSFDICPVCFWEDDPVQWADPSYEGGANGPSLNTARKNFKTFGAFEEKFVGNVRAPRPEELPPQP